MTAQEAKKAAQESKQIMEDISKAVFNGKNEIVVTSLSDTVHKGLKSLGYAISYEGGGFDHSFYTIKW